METIITDELGNKIISIDIYRDGRRRLDQEKQCSHSHIIIDRSYTTIECADCHKQLNPVEWIIGLADWWTAIHRKYEDYRGALAEYDKRKRVKCRSCGAFTPL